MVNEVKYTNIRRVLDNLNDDALMGDLTLEQAVRYTIRFISLNGQPNLYQDKVGEVRIHEYRGQLPCDLISIKQVRDMKSGVCLRSMTDNFPDGMQDRPQQYCTDPMNNMRHTPYIPPMTSHKGELTFKANNRIIFTSFPEGMVQVAYQAIPVDDDGFPLLIGNEVFIDALEAYITMRVLRNKWRRGDISSQVYQDAKQEYAWAAGKLNSEFMIPSVSEMQSIAALWNTMIPQTRHFHNGFKNLGDVEYLKNQQ